MGAKVSTSKHPKDLTNPINHNDPTPQSSIIELLKPECLKVKKKKKKKKQKQRLLHPQGKILNEAETQTLQECLLASPRFDQVFLANTDVGEVCGLMPSKVHPSCLGPVDDAALSLKARDSLSSERPVNVHTEVEDNCHSEVCSLRRSKKGDSKRVWFRLPQESDIIFFCSPKKERLEFDEERDA